MKPKMNNIKNKELAIGITYNQPGFDILLKILKLFLGSFVFANFINISLSQRRDCHSLSYDISDGIDVLTVEFDGAMLGAV